MCPVVRVAGTARGIGLGMAARLLLERAGFVTGQEFGVDGSTTWRVIYRG